MDNALVRLESKDDGALYSLAAASEAREAGCGDFVFSSPPSRAILCDSEICGLEYTNNLRSACTRALKLYRPHCSLQISEEDSGVLNILRGGLAFGLRECLAESFDWQMHQDLFMSCQREPIDAAKSEWKVTENDYRKLSLGSIQTLFVGEVVATGTTLQFALHTLLGELQKSEAELRKIVLLVVGSPETLRIAHAFSAQASSVLNYPLSVDTIFLEGCFSVPTAQTQLPPELPGTDLVIRNAILAPEFLEKKLTSADSLVERCVVYDSGSRAFAVRDYHKERLEYFRDLEVLADAGLTYPAFIESRYPALAEQISKDKDLKNLCISRRERISSLLSG